MEKTPPWGDIFDFITLFDGLFNHLHYCAKNHFDEENGEHAAQLAMEIWSICPDIEITEFEEFGIWETPTRWPSDIVAWTAKEISSNTNRYVKWLNGQEWYKRAHEIFSNKIDTTLLDTCEILRKYSKDENTYKTAFLNIAIAYSLIEFKIIDDPKRLVRPKKTDVENSIIKAKELRNAINKSPYLRFKFNKLLNDLVELISFNLDDKNFHEKKIHEQLERNEFIRILYDQLKCIFEFKSLEKYKVPADLLLPLASFLDPNIDERTVRRQVKNFDNEANKV